jgi:hypothetical protein
VTKKTRFFSKKLLIIAAIPLLIVIYFFDNIKGQYRFHQYCKNEGGLRVYEALEKKEGLEAKDYYSARSALQLKHVEFVRFIDIENNNRLYDLKYTGGNREFDSSYQKFPANESKEASYVWTIETSFVQGESRLNRTSYKIIDKKNGKLAAVYKVFVYSQFDQNKSLFSAPSYVYCFNKTEEIFREFNKIFSNN